MFNPHQIFSVHVTYGHSSIILWQLCDTLCISGFADNIMFPIVGPGVECKLKVTHQKQQCTDLHRLHHGVY